MQLGRFTRTAGITQHNTVICVACLIQNSKHRCHLSRHLRHIAVFQFEQGHCICRVNLHPECTVSDVQNTVVQRNGVLLRYDVFNFFRFCRIQQLLKLTHGRLVYSDCHQIAICVNQAVVENNCFHLRPICWNRICRQITLNDVTTKADIHRHCRVMPSVRIYDFNHKTFNVVHGQRHGDLSVRLSENCAIRCKIPALMPLSLQRQQKEDLSGRTMYRNCNQ